MAVASIADDGPMYTTAPPQGASAVQPIDLQPEVATAGLLGVKVQTLRKWAVQRRGPPRVKVGKRVFYRPEAVTAWLAKQERDPSVALAGG